MPQLGAGSHFSEDIRHPPPHQVLADAFDDIDPIGIALKVGSYTLTIETVPPFLALLMAQCRTVAAPACRCVVSRWKGGGKRHCIVTVEVLRYHGRADIGHRYPHEFGLATIVAAGRVRIAIDGADGRGFRIGVVAVAVKLALAKETRTAEYVERHQHMVAHFQVLYLRADLFHHTGEFMAEGHADPGIGHQTVIQVQVGATDAGARYAHGGVARMLDHGSGFCCARTR